MADPGTARCRGGDVQEAARPRSGACSARAGAGRAEARRRCASPSSRKLSQKICHVPRQSLSFFLACLLRSFLPSSRPHLAAPPPHVRICPQERYHRLPTICPPWPCPGWRMLIACASCPAHQRNSRSRNPGHMQVDLLTQPENILAVREHLPRVDVRSTAPRPYRAPADLWGPPARVLAGFTHPCAPPNPRTPRTAGTPGEGNQLSTPSNSVSRNRKNS